jgi:hypothetical protein
MQLVFQVLFAVISTGVFVCLFVVVWQLVADPVWLYWKFCGPRSSGRYGRNRFFAAWSALGLYVMIFFGVSALFWWIPGGVFNPLGYESNSLMQEGIAGFAAFFGAILISDVICQYLRLVYRESEAGE